MMMKSDGSDLCDAGVRGDLMCLILNFFLSGMYATADMG